MTWELKGGSSLKPWLLIWKSLFIFISWCPATQHSTVTARHHNDSDSCGPWRPSWQPPLALQQWTTFCWRLIMTLLISWCTAYVLYYAAIKSQIIFSLNRHLHFSVAILSLTPDTCRPCPRRGLFELSHWCKGGHSPKRSITESHAAGVAGICNTLSTGLRSVIHWLRQLQSNLWVAQEVAWIATVTSACIPDNNSWISRFFRIQRVCYIIESLTHIMRVQVSDTSGMWGNYMTKVGRWIPLRPRCSMPIWDSLVLFKFTPLLMDVQVHNSTVTGSNFCQNTKVLITNVAANNTNVFFPCLSHSKRQQKHHSAGFHDSLLEDSSLRLLWHSLSHWVIPVISKAFTERATVFTGSPTVWSMLLSLFLSAAQAVWVPTLLSSSS